jgi:hypothetical protein
MKKDRVEAAKFYLLAKQAGKSDPDLEVMMQNLSSPMNGRCRAPRPRLLPKAETEAAQPVRRQVRRGNNQLIISSRRQLQLDAPVARLGFFRHARIKRLELAKACCHEMLGRYALRRQRLNHGDGTR